MTTRNSRSLKSGETASITSLSPSAFVRKCAERIAQGSEGKPILDLACGSGRNGLYLASLGCKVIFSDRDLSRLPASKRISSLQMDLERDPWPFAPGSLGGIMSVHFILPSLFPYLAAALASGGYLLLETVPACGCNYLELPQVGSLSRALTRDFEFEVYRESRTGPTEIGAVTVRLLARRRYSVSS